MCHHLLSWAYICLVDNTQLIPWPSLANDMSAMVQQCFVEPCNLMALNISIGDLGQIIQNVEVCFKQWWGETDIPTAMLIGMIAECMATWSFIFFGASCKIPSQICESEKARQINFSHTFVTDGEAEVDSCGWESRVISKQSLFPGVPKSRID